MLLILKKLQHISLAPATYYSNCFSGKWLPKSKKKNSVLDFPITLISYKFSEFLQGNIGYICAKLQAALSDAAKYRLKLHEEISKREKAEMDLASLIQQVSI